ncbi:MAG: TlpA family protein disulfide reductase [Campylobacter sp.]|nr:TlpA family protein disulfide reductase [Campylobacter sp.]
MKFKICIIAFVSAFLIFGCGNNDKKQDQNQTSQAPKKVFKDITLNLLNDQNITLKGRENDGLIIKNNDKATMFIFFATWCPPCKAEIPHINNLHEKFKDDLNIIAVLLEDKNPQEVKQWAKDFGVKYNIAVGKGNFEFESLIGGAPGLPSSAIFKANGDFFNGFTGLMPEEMLESEIEKAIK